VKALMCSALRLREAAYISDAEIEPREDGLWLCLGPARMKAKKAHAIPICAMFAEIIASAPRRGKSGLVFTMCSGRPVVGFSAIKYEIDNAAATIAGELSIAPPQPWTLHDLRRSARTRWSAIDVPDVVKELGIAHSLGSSVRQTYDRYSYADQLRSLFEQWESRLLAIVGGNVVVLHTGAAPR
jgi:integrase